MDRITEIQALLTNDEQRVALTDDEVAALEQELMALFDAVRAGEVEGTDAGDVELLGAIVAAIDQVREEAASRLEAAEQNAEEIERLARRARGESDEPAAVEDDESEPAAAESTDESESESESVEENEPEPVLASSVAPAPAAPALPSLAELAARRQGVAPAGRMARTEDPLIRALERGDNVSLNEFARILIEKRGDFGAYHGRGEEKIRLGRFSIKDRFSPERVINSADGMIVNTAKVDALCAGAADPSNWTDDSLVASGGFCAPTEALYDVEQISVATRPLRDGLPDFQADRGGIRFVPPPNLADVLVDQSGGAVGEWSNTTDITPGESVKTCQTVACDDPSEVYTRAIYRCLGFGNFQTRAYPERVQAWILNAAAAWASKAEQEALDDISANSAPVTTTLLLGATRDLFAMVIQLAAAERNRQRMDPEARLRVVFPSWVVDMMHVDLIRQQPGDGLENTIGATRDRIRGWFANANVNVSFHQDQRTGGDQIFGAQGAGNDLRDFPDVVEWFLFHEGAHVYLDGGELDLGLVRDTTTNETNDYRIFAEHWQAVAFRGIFSYRVRSTVCPNGQSALPITTATLCSAS